MCVVLYLLLKNLPILINEEGSGHRTSILEFSSGTSPVVTVSVRPGESSDRVFV